MNPQFSDADLAMHSLFGNNSSSTQQYIQQQAQSYMQSLQNSNLGQFATNAINNVQNLFNFFNNGEINNRIQRFKHQYSTYWDEDVIRYLDNAIAIQNAKTVMQRWVMANPTINALYNDGRINGYSDSYTVSSDYAKADNYNYRLAMSGVAVEEDNVTKVTSYAQSIEENDRLLNVYEKLSIQRTWKQIEDLISEGVDPTSPNNESIG